MKNKVINPYDGKKITIEEKEQIEKDLKEIMDDMYKKEMEEIINDITRE